MPQTDGHVRVAGEVKVDLERVRDGADPRRDRCGVRHGGDVLPDGAHLVGDEHLLAQTDHQPLQTLAGLAHRLPPMLQVIGYCLVLHDRPRDQLGEQRHVRAEVHDVPLGRHQKPRMVSLKINISTAAKAPSPVIRLRGDLLINMEMMTMMATHEKIT